MNKARMAVQPLEKAPKFFVENGRAIGYVHPYTIQKFWTKSLFENLNSLLARRPSRSRKAKPLKFCPLDSLIGAVN
jgi:hypothetical protein